MFFVPASEVELLLSEINTALNLTLKLPGDEGFCLTFFNDGTPVPQFLGTSHSRSGFNTMEKQVPIDGFKAKGDYALAGPSDDRSLKAFRQKMEAAMLATKNKSKATVEKKKLQRVQSKDSRCSFPLPTVTYSRSIVSFTWKCVKPTTIWSINVLYVIGCLH